jgi:hypothetical protein
MQFLKINKYSFFQCEIYIKKDLKAKEELWKPKYFTMQKHNLQKNPLKGILYSSLKD